MAKTIVKQAEMVANLNEHSKNSSANESEDNSVFSDMRYVCKSCSLITESLQKGCDVIQMPNGDIIVTEMRPVTLQYTWDSKKGKIVRSSAGAGAKRGKKRSKQDVFDNDDDLEF